MAFLAGRDGGEEFSRVDKETLVMFASQAALVITNARCHRIVRAIGNLKPLTIGNPQCTLKERIYARNSVPFMEWAHAEK